MSTSNHSLPELGPAPSAPPDPHGRWPTTHVAAALVAVAVAAGVAGALVGRATKPDTAPSPGPTWRALPTAPLSGRIAESAVWTGKELIVWGGVTAAAVRRRARATAARATGRPTTRPLAPGG